MKRRTLILARHKKEMTQVQVAKYLGVSQGRYSKIETGVGTPTLEQTQALIELLEIDVNIL